MEKLKDRDTLWGNSIQSLKAYSKKYRLTAFFIYLFDILMVIGAVFFMYCNRSSVQVYIVIMISITLIVVLSIYAFLNVQQWQAYKFYRKYQNKDIHKLVVNVDAEKLYSIIYLMNYKRLKEGKSIEEYKELILSACCEDKINAKKFYQNIKKYEDNENGTLQLYVIDKYFIDFTESYNDGVIVDNSTNSEEITVEEDKKDE